MWQSRSSCPTSSSYFISITLLLTRFACVTALSATLRSSLERPSDVSTRWCFTRFISRSLKSGHQASRKSRMVIHYKNPKHEFPKLCASHTRVLHKSFPEQTSFPSPTLVIRSYTVQDRVGWTNYRRELQRCLQHCPTEEAARKTGHPYTNSTGTKCCRKPKRGELGLALIVS